MHRAGTASGADESVARPDGPWSHRDITANGARFHALEAGQGPLVLLLHGFPEIGWAFRHQISALAAAGFRAVAPDLRGYGGSDKPPRGYDAMTLAADCAGMVRALGERDAVVVGSDWGGLLGWTMAGMHPGVVRRLVVLAAPHPLAVRTLLQPAGQLGASSYVGRFQLPRLAEHYLIRAGAVNVERLLRAWSGPGWPDRQAAARYRMSMRIPGVAHSSLEYYRWAVRSLPRSDGRRWARAMRPPVSVPTLQIHGALDSCVLPVTAESSWAVTGPYAWELLEDVGHFPHEESPERVSDLVVDWAARDDG